MSIAAMQLLLLAAMLHAVVALGSTAAAASSLLLKATAEESCPSRRSGSQVIRDRLADGDDALHMLQVKSSGKAAHRASSRVAARQGDFVDAAAALQPARGIRYAAVRSAGGAHKKQDPTIGSASSAEKAEVATLTSDGSDERPYCFVIPMYDGCDFGEEEKASCAQALCQASGYDNSSYLSDDGDPCDPRTALPGFYHMATQGVTAYMDSSGADQRTFTAITVTCRNPTKSAQDAAAGGVLIVSDGTEEKPFCYEANIYAGCVYGSTQKDMCAAELCRASGYEEYYHADSSNLCIPSLTSEGYYYALDLDASQQFGENQTYLHWAKVSAWCRTLATTTTAEPEYFPPPPPPAPAYGPYEEKPVSEHAYQPYNPYSGDEEDVIHSDGSEDRPYCVNPDVFDHHAVCPSIAQRRECAKALCKAANFDGGILRLGGDDFCIHSGAPAGFYYAVRMGIVEIEQDTPVPYAAVTAKCANFTTITSDGSENLPHCLFYGNPQDCDYGEYQQAECASALCKAAGLRLGSLAPADDELCEAKPASPGTYYIVGEGVTQYLDLPPPELGLPLQWATVTAKCRR